MLKLANQFQEIEHKWKIDHKNDGFYVHIHFGGNDRYLSSRMENDKITIPRKQTNKRWLDSIRFDSIPSNPIRFYLIFIYFQQDSKAMTCLCFKLIDLFWFYCFDTIVVHFISYASICCILCARTRSHSKNQQTIRCSIVESQ